MNVLWRRGSATVADVVEALPGRVPLAYSTVITTLRILESKGYVAHRKDGRAFVYFPLKERDEERRKAVKHLLGRFFNGSAEALMLNLIEGEKISAEELERLRQKIAEEKS